MESLKLTALKLLRQRATGDYKTALDAAIRLMEAAETLDSIPGPRRERRLYVGAGSARYKHEVRSVMEQLETMVESHRVAGAS